MLTTIIFEMPLTTERTKIRIVLIFAGLASLVALLFATGKGNDQRQLYDRFFLYLPASSFLLVLVLVLTDVCVGIVERRSTPDARVLRARLVLASGLAVTAVLVATVLLSWFS